MPHYYLDLRYFQLVVEDPVGYDFENLGSAVRVAQALLSRLHSDGGCSPLDGARVEISDDNGWVATLPRLNVRALAE